VFSYPGVAHLTLKASYDLSFSILLTAFFLIAVFVIAADFLVVS